MRVLRECMPTHQAAQREANQTGQPTVRILIKLSVTGEQRAHRGHAREEERGAEGGAGGYPFVALRSTTCGTSHLRTKLSPRVPLSLTRCWNVEGDISFSRPSPNFTRLALFVNPR